MASVVQCVAHMQGGYYSAFFPLSVFPYVAWGCLELTVLKAGSELLVPLSSPASSVLYHGFLTYTEEIQDAPSMHWPSAFQNN